MPLSAVAAVVLALHLATNGRYGWFRDELYFLACGQRLAWGYVDQPPLIALVGRIATSLFGMSLWGVRLFPALAATGLVVLTGAFARRLGGGAFAMALAGLAAGLAPTFLVGGHLFTMNAFEPLIWTGCAWGVVSLVDAPRPRAWLALGALLGVGLLNKYSVGFFAVCLVLGLLLSRERRALRSPWLLASIGLCVLLVVPNILWQRANGWPMLELLRNGQLNKNTPFDAGAFLANQVLQLNPLALPLWLLGLWFLLRREEGRRYRALGFAFLLNLALFIAMRAKA
ncbi:MAG TPA: glycosyltransferase family 39 protein, partial [Myxococcaceae bacterium]|nr:glycosyltransferase family 39 protein [Myxococcaceae bacterium]